MKSLFCVFLDIDGVLNNYNFIKEITEKHPLSKYPNFNRWAVFDPKSIEGLNYLLTELDKYFEVELVVSSSRNCNMNKTLKQLKDNKVDFSKITKISKTEDLNNRAFEILKHIKNNNICKNFVILDDEMFEYKKYNLDKNLIKTDFKKQSLNIDMVKNYLTNNMSQFITETFNN